MMARIWARDMIYWEKREPPWVLGPRPTRAFLFLILVGRTWYNPDHTHPGQRLHDWRVATIRMTSENLALKLTVRDREPRSEASPTTGRPPETNKPLRRPGIA